MSWEQDACVLFCVIPKRIAAILYPCAWHSVFLGVQSSICHVSEFIDRLWYCNREVSDAGFVFSLRALKRVHVSVFPKVTQLGDSRVGMCVPGTAPSALPGRTFQDLAQSLWHSSENEWVMQAWVKTYMKTFFLPSEVVQQTINGFITALTPCSCWQVSDPTDHTPCLGSGSIFVWGKPLGHLWVSIVPKSKIRTPTCLCDDACTLMPIWCHARDMEHARKMSREENKKERKTCSWCALKRRIVSCQSSRTEDDLQGAAVWKRLGDESVLLDPWLTCSWSWLLTLLWSFTEHAQWTEICLDTGKERF